MSHPDPHPTTAPGRAAYPPARRDDLVETLHGHEVADPYRWLEDADSAETAAFVAAQNAHSEPQLASLPDREAFRRITRALATAPTRGCPWVVAGRFLAWHGDGQDQPVLVVADSVDGLEERPRVLLDPNTLSADGTVAVTAASVSPDGALLAYAVADGGSDWNTLRVRDVETGVDLDDEVPWTKWNHPVWLPDGPDGERSFSYWAYPAPTGDALTDETGAGRLLAHRVGAPVDDDVVLWERPEAPRTFARHWPEDDTWFVLSTDTGASSGNDLAVRRHDDPAGPGAPLRFLAEGHEHERRVVGIRDGRVLVVTDEGSPRYRLDAIDLTTGERATVVPEHPEDVLVDASLTPNGLVLLLSHDASHRVQLAGPDGTLGEELPLGGAVSVTGLHTDRDSGLVLLRTEGFTDRGTRHAFEVDGGHVTSTRSRPTPGPPAPAATTTRVRATSSDGVEVPAFLVRPAHADTDGPAPTLVWGYGGFNIAMNPEFRIVLAAWVAAGGTLVVPNLRGGGEFGSAWHEGGTQGRKQQVFDDLHAVAEHLVATGVSTPDRMALHGRSNGGLLAGASLTQRPDLWAAVLPAVGVLDMLRFHRFTIGWAWTSDYGDPEVAEDFAHLVAYSPLHQVRDRVYPATLVTTGDHDDRVVPAHSLKFAATLQRAQERAGGTAPVLLSVDTRAGHGAGKPREAAAMEHADQLAFAAHHTGLRVPDQPTDDPGTGPS